MGGLPINVSFSVKFWGGGCGGNLKLWEKRELNKYLLTQKLIPMVFKRLMTSSELLILDATDPFQKWHHGFT